MSAETDLGRVSIMGGSARVSENGRSFSRSMAVGLLAFVWVAEPVMAEGTGEAEEAFGYQERSTIENIPFQSVEEEALANTVIEGGLAAPAAGVPTSPTGDDDFYLDPLALQPGDSRTDLGRSEIPAEFRFSNPKSIPGQSHSNNYVIRPPENRNYDALNINMTER